MCKGKCIKTNPDICISSLECGSNKRCLYGACVELLSINDGEKIYAVDEFDLLLCSSKTGVLADAREGYEFKAGKQFVSGEYVCG